MELAVTGTLLYHKELMVCVRFIYWNYTRTHTQWYHPSRHFKREQLEALDNTNSQQNVTIRINFSDLMCTLSMICFRASDIGIRSRALAFF